MQLKEPFTVSSNLSLHVSYPASSSTKASELQVGARRKVILQVGWGIFLDFWECTASLRHRLDAAACISASHMPSYNLRQGSISITNPFFFFFLRIYFLAIWLHFGVNLHRIYSQAGKNYFSCTMLKSNSASLGCKMVKEITYAHKHSQAHTKAYTNICPQRDLLQKRQANANKLNFRSELIWLTLLF